MQDLRIVVVSRCRGAKRREAAKKGYDGPKEGGVCGDQTHDEARARRRGGRLRESRRQLILHGSSHLGCGLV
ncbi:MAG: hypothetical protein ACI835_005139 [Planctomycetota bacterium]|jgi:hypothetical protein